MMDIHPLALAGRRCIPVVLVLASSHDSDRNLRGRVLATMKTRPSLLMHEDSSRDVANDGLGPILCTCGRHSSSSARSLVEKSICRRRRQKRETISKVHETDRGENIGSSLMYRPVACSRLCFDDYYADVASCFKVIAGLDK